MISIDSASFVRPPKFIQPKQRRLTFKPVRPRLLYSIMRISRISYGMYIYHIGWLAGPILELLPGVGWNNQNFAAFNCLRFAVCNDFYFSLKNNKCLFIGMAMLIGPFAW